MSSQRGFALTALLFLMPALLAFVLLFAGSALSVLKSSQSLHLCRTGLLNVQGTLSQHLEDLLKLNRVAQRLRIERKKADTLASVPGPQLPAAQAYQKAVIAQQLILRARQLQILQTARAQATSSLIELRRKLGPAATSWPLPILAVRPSPPQSLSPDYIPVLNFEQRQALRIALQIKFELKREVFLNATIDDLKTECSATIRKEGSKWQATLGKGKFLLNSSL